MNRTDKPIKQNIVAFFQKRKVLTIAELKEFSQLSQRTIERRLKQWKTYRSYNHNGCYYVLPEIPEFNSEGIWKYKEMRFSKHGGLRSSMIALVEQSSSGLSAKDLSQSLRCSVLDALSYFKENSELLREREAGRYIYFSSNPVVYAVQKQRRREWRQSQAKGNYSGTQLIDITCDFFEDLVTTWIFTNVIHWNHWFLNFRIKYSNIFSFQN